MANGTDTIDLFLCHNGADKPWVERLAEQVESETVDGSPSSRTLKVFFDKWDIDIGQNVITRINHGLANARYVAIVLSPELLAAPWPTLEWTHVVADDPTNRKGRLIPLFARSTSLDGKNSIDLPAPFKALNWIDFRQPKEFKKSFQRLIRKIRDLPPARGARRRPIASVRSPAASVVPSSPDNPAAPDRIPEAILGNLLPVESVPSIVWSAPTEARKNMDVYELVTDCFGFTLQEKRLYTCADLNKEDEPLRVLVDAKDIQRHAVTRWRTDPVRWRWFITILNRNLKNYTGRMPIKKDQKGRFFFRPNKDDNNTLTNRVWQNGSDPKRDVAAMKVNEETGEAFWVHHSAWLKFQTLGDSIFLSIEPSYVFTADGQNPLEGPSVGPLTIAWGGKERNAAILRHVIFWARTLGRGQAKATIPTGGEPIIISGIPAIARTTFGLDFDHIGIGTLLSQIDDELKHAASAVSLAPTREPISGEDDDHAAEEEPE
jgi:hypothetical protein